MIDERFWEKVDKNGPTMPGMESPCYVWTAALDDGYGVFNLDGGKPTRAHRYAFEIQNCPIPDGHGVLHRCDNRACVRGSHLFTGLNGDNNRDRHAKGRSARGTRLAVLKQGERSPTAKLNGMQVMAIRTRVADGERLVDLAAEFKVASCTIIAIRDRRTWRHI